MRMCCECEATISYTSMMCSNMNTQNLESCETWIKMWIHLTKQQIKLLSPPSTAGVWFSSDSRHQAQLQYGSPQTLATKHSWSMILLRLSPPSTAGVWFSSDSRHQAQLEYDSPDREDFVVRSYCLLDIYLLRVFQWSLIILHFYLSML